MQIKCKENANFFLFAPFSAAFIGGVSLLMAKEKIAVFCMQAPKRYFREMTERQPREDREKTESRVTCNFRKILMYLMERVRWMVGGHENGRF